jgi:molybdopterin-guanine dinucleotide biosynthesis protein A
MNTTGVILAGGKSSRMGQDKSMMKFEQETLISRCLRSLAGYVDELIIVGNQRDKYLFPGVTEVTDAYEDIGPLAGIHAGLQAAANQYVFFAACDMPFIEGRLVTLLLENTPGFDVVVPRTGGFSEPLFAVYSKVCLPYIESNIEKKRFRIVDFYPLVNVNYIEEAKIRQVADPGQAFANINTPEEYRKLCPSCSTPPGLKNCLRNKKSVII